MSPHEGIKRASSSLCEGGLWCKIQCGPQPFVTSVTGCGKTSDGCWWRRDGCPASLCLCSLKWEGAFVWRAMSSLVKQNLSPPQAVMELITKMAPELLKRLINRFEDQSFSEVITFWCNVMSPAKLVFLVSSTGNRAYCDPWLLYLRRELAVWLKIMCIWQKDHKASVLSLNSISQIPFAGRMHLFCLIG